MGIVLSGFRALGLLAGLPAALSVRLLPFNLLLAAALALASPWEQRLLAPGQGLLSSLALEFLLGFAIGLPFSLIVHGAEMCGELFDLSRGQSLSLVYDPLSNVNQAQTGLLLRYYTLAALLLQGVWEPLIKNFRRSFEVYPRVADTLHHELVLHGRAIAQLIAQSCGHAFQFFLPLAFCLLALELALAIVSRTLNGASLNNEAFTLKTACGTVLALAILQWAPFGGLYAWIAVPGYPR